MSSTNIFTDWKKQASQVASRNKDKDQQEQAFMNLAYGYVSQKAGKLMEDPHRLGFEIVYTNDDCSKMAGMFAFRVSDSLVSVPAIFINNDVKGTELMYEHDTKLVRPLSVDWADYIISKHQDPDGAMQDRDVTSKMISGMHLDKISGRGNMLKRASDQQKAWEEVFEELEAHEGKLADILPEFLVDAGQSAMTKLATAIESSVDFANALAGLDEDLYMPPVMEKQASAELPSKIELYLRHFPMTKMSKDENEKAHERGWFMWENRPDTDLKPAVVDAEALVSEISDPGLYDIITTDNDTKRAWVLNRNTNDSLCDPSPYPSTEPTRAGSCEKIIVWEDGTTVTARDMVWGEMADTDNGSTWQWSDSDLPEKPSAGEAYYAVDETGSNALGPYKFTSVKTRDDGITVLREKPRYGDEEKVHYINPDYNGVHEDDDSTVFGSSTRWVKVKTEKSKYSDGWSVVHSKTKPGDKRHLMLFLAGNGIKKITVEKEPDGPGFKVSEGDEPVMDEIDGINTAVKTATIYGIHSNDAMNLVDMAKRFGVASVWIDSNPVMVKSAMQVPQTTMTPLGVPNHQLGYDSDLRVMTDPPQSWNIDTATTQPYAPPRHLGDAYDPSLGTSPGNQDSFNYVSDEAKAAGVTDKDLFTGSPEDVAQLYTERNIPNLFQHGTVGMLVSTYDSSGMIAKYIPKLEEGLDHFGRILFLFYWKPQDFEKLYGADDLSNLEQELLSQFRSFGDILLQLIKKNETKTGSVPTP